MWRLIRVFQGWYRNRNSKFQDFSRTFQGLFTFSQESFFIDSNSPNTAYTQDFCPIQDRKCISLLFLPDFSSVYCLRTLLSFLPFPISALQGFTSGCIRFVLLESNRIKQNTMVALPLNTASHFVFYYRFCNSLDFYCALHPQKNCFYHFQGHFVIVKEIFSKFKDKLHFFRIPGVFQDQGHFQGLFKVCANPGLHFLLKRKSFYVKLMKKKST